MHRASYYSRKMPRRLGEFDLYNPPTEGLRLPALGCEEGSTQSECLPCVYNPFKVVKLAGNTQGRPSRSRANLGLKDEIPYGISQRDFDTGFSKGISSRVWAGYRDAGNFNSTENSKELQNTSTISEEDVGKDQR